MALRPRNPLAGGLLEVSTLLAEIRGRKIVEQAALRRAISSAYYALFHTLCQVCSDGLGLWTSGDERGLLYRHLSHARAKEVLASSAARSLHADLEQVGNLVIELRTLRERADYSGPGRFGAERKLLTRRETLALIATAEEAVSRLDNLPLDVRRRLAVLLTVGLGRGQKET